MKETKIGEKKTVPAKKVAGQFVAVAGGNLADGKRFEIGEVLVNLSDAEIKALTAMQAIKSAE